MQNKDYEKIFFDNADPDNLEKVTEEQLFFFQNFIDENVVIIVINICSFICTVEGTYLDRTIWI